jgi:uncharacterized protein (TIGR02678 family)
VEPYPDTEQGRLLQRRHRVTRALVEEPVLYRTDLTDGEIEYMRSQRARLEKLLAERVGLALEVRIEGWLTVDETGELSDLRWPDYGTAETTALRLCDELRGRRLRGDPDVWPGEQVRSFVRDMAVEYAGYWKKNADDAAGSQRLAAEAIDILVAARIASRADQGDGRRDTCGLRALPAAARYAAAEPVRPAPTLHPLDTSLSDDGLRIAEETPS